MTKTARLAVAWSVAAAVSEGLGPGSRTSLAGDRAVGPAPSPHPRAALSARRRDVVERPHRHWLAHDQPRASGGRATPSWGSCAATAAHRNERRSPAVSMRLGEIAVPREGWARRPTLQRAFTLDRSRSPVAGSPMRTKPPLAVPASLVPRVLRPSVAAPRTAKSSGATCLPHAFGPMVGPMRKRLAREGSRNACPRASGRARKRGQPIRPPAMRRHVQARSPASRSGAPSTG